MLMFYLRIEKLKQTNKITHWKFLPRPINPQPIPQFSPRSNPCPREVVIHFFFQQKLLCLLPRDTHR